LAPDDRLPAELLARAKAKGGTAADICGWIPAEAERKRRRHDPITSPGYFRAVFNVEFSAWQYLNKAAEPPAATSWPSREEVEAAEMERVEALRCTVMPLRQAGNLFESRGLCPILDGRIRLDGAWAESIPAELIAELETAGMDLITPAELLERKRGWSPCPTCRNRGTVYVQDGNYLQLLAWCTCPAGERKRAESPDEVDGYNLQIKAQREKLARIAGKPKWNGSQKPLLTSEPMNGFRPVTEADFVGLGVVVHTDTLTNRDGAAGSAVSPDAGECTAGPPDG
jgi:hypothetical protein